MIKNSSFLVSLSTASKSATDKYNVGGFYIRYPTFMNLKLYSILIIPFASYTDAARTRYLSFSSSIPLTTVCSHFYGYCTLADSSGVASKIDKENLRPTLSSPVGGTAMSTDDWVTIPFYQLITFTDPLNWWNAQLSSGVYIMGSFIIPGLYDLAGITDISMSMQIRLTADFQAV